MTNEKEEGVTMENNFDNTPENNGQQPEQPVYTDPNADVNQQSTGGEGTQQGNAGDQPQYQYTYQQPQNQGQAQGQSQNTNYQQYQDNYGNYNQGYNQNYNQNYNGNYGNYTSANPQGYGQNYSQQPQMDTNPMTMGRVASDHPGAFYSLRGHHFLLCMGFWQEGECEPEELLPGYADRLWSDPGDLHLILPDLWPGHRRSGDLLLLIP